MFALNGEHRVVIALNGSANINGIPAQLLIAAWGKTLTAPLDHLSDYALRFSEWLAAEQHLVPATTDEQVVQFVLNDHYFDIRHEVVNKANQSDLDENQISSFFKDYVKHSFEYLHSLESYDQSSDADDLHLLHELGVDVEGKIESYLGEFPGFTDLKDDLIRQAPLVLSRIQDMGSDTNLVFIGFGQSEYFASSIEFKLRGRYGQRTRGFLKSPFPDTPHYTHGLITALAQRDAILGFAYGAEDRILNRITDQIFNYIVSKFENREEGEKEANNYLEFLNEDRRKYSFETYLLPLLNSVAALNLSDAAEFAESLVGIQAMRAKASPKPAGVGGFIESLVIDKFEGVRWIKRLPR
jgi:hypothetical protein